MRSLWSVVPYMQLCSYCALLLLVIHANREPIAASRQSLAARFLSFFGYISYGLYLIHQLVSILLIDGFKAPGLRQKRGPGWGLWLNALIGTLIATGILWLSRRYFEGLFLHQKDKLAPSRNAEVNEKPVAEAA